VHNFHKNAPSGCRFSKKGPPQKSTPSTSSKKKKGAPDPVWGSSSDSSESEDEPQLEEEAEEVVSNSSSSYAQSRSSDDDTDSDSSNTNRKNIIQNHIDECELSGGESSVSFHDDSDFESDVDDLEMVDLFSDSDDSEEEGGIDPNSEGVNPANWTEEGLLPSSGGKFVPGRTIFPKFLPKIAPGPINIPPATSFAVDYFQLYFDSSLMNEFVINTNIMGAKIFESKKKGPNGSHMGRWSPTSMAELYRLFGVLLHMGIKRLPSIRSYWSNDTRYSDPFVKKCFTRDRFEKLKVALHIINPNEFTLQEQKAKQKVDPFWRVTPLLTVLSSRFRRYFKCSQNIDIDEMCIGFKGRHVARCYNPNKPEKWHLKAFCLNDSATGYLHRFYMYHGMLFIFF
jgi:hypothetical protein